jgi:broad specificity phosphatase PhoE
LSDKGRHQAKAIARHFQKVADEAFPNEKPLLLSSPRRRCLETLEPLSKKTQVQVKADARLLEQEPQEDMAQFQKRILDFERWWKEEAPPLVVACSHGDWLPIAIARITGAAVGMEKGAWAEIRMEDHPRKKQEDRVSLTWLRQSLDD